jgi:hypothetical protein
MTTPQPSRSAVGAGTSDVLGRVAAAVGALAFLPFGVWAMLAPRSFFDQLAEFHPYNEHFIQDIGAFQIGLGAVLLLVALRPAVDALTAGLVGTGVGAAAHAISHVVGHDLGGRPASDIPMFSVIAVVLLAVGALRARAGDRRTA